MAEKPVFTWDIENDEDRARYIWPREDVLAWWDTALEKGWCVTEVPDVNAAIAEASLGNEDLGKALADLVPALRAIGLDWFSPCGEKDGKPLYWDPFHLPLYDPHTGELTAKHGRAHRDKPETERKPFETFHSAFAKALWERMKTGTDVENLAPCQGFVVPSGIDLSLDIKDDSGEDLEGEALEARIEDDTLNPELFADFSQALFGHSFVIRLRRFGAGDVKDGRARPAISFQSARFGDRAWFERARFGDRALFGSARFGDGASFGSARFGDGAWFGSARFGDRASFGSARFGDGASFERVRFGDWARFGNAEFLGAADFSLGTPHENRSDDHMEITQQDTGDDETGLRFTVSRNLNDVPGWQSQAAFKTISFQGAFFLGHVTFENRKFGGASDFNDAIFVRPPKFHDALLHRDTSFLEAQFFAAPGAPLRFVETKLSGDTDDEEWTTRRAGAIDRYKTYLGEWQADKAVEFSQTDVAQGKPVRPKVGLDFERAFQTLKIAMDQTQARSDEQMFFAYELKSRRSRTDSSVTSFERAFSYLYDWTSGYGRSIGWPAIWLLIAVPAFMLGLYSGLGLVFSQPLEPPLYEFQQWASFLYEPALNPISPLNLAKIHKGFQCESLIACRTLLYDLSIGQSVFMLVAAFHRVLNVVLLFILLLAIRRRFQIT